MVAIVVGLVVLVAAVAMLSETPRPSRTRTTAGDDVPTEQFGDQQSLKNYQELCKRAESYTQEASYNLPEAFKLYELAAELMPAHPLAHFNLARVC